MQELPNTALVSAALGWTDEFVDYLFAEAATYDI